MRSGAGKNIVDRENGDAHDFRIRSPPKKCATRENRDRRDWGIGNSRQNGGSIALLGLLKLCFSAIGRGDRERVFIFESPHRGNGPRFADSKTGLCNSM